MDAPRFCLLGNRIDQLTALGLASAAYRLGVFVCDTLARSLSATLHNVQVWAEGSVDCRDNTGAMITCSSGTLAGYATSTKVGIGKASLVLQEENNTNLK